MPGTLFGKLAPEQSGDALARDGSGTVDGENGEHGPRLAGGDGNLPAFLVVEPEATQQRQTEFRHADR